MALEGTIVGAYTPRIEAGTTKVEPGAAGAQGSARFTVRTVAASAKCSLRPLTVNDHAKT
jgi:hypothetical protein